MRKFISLNVLFFLGSIVITIILFVFAINEASEFTSIHHGKFNISEIRNTLSEKVDMIIIVGALCDYGDSSANILCNDLRLKSAEARVIALKLAEEIQKQCSPEVSQSLIYNLIALNTFLKFSYEERDNLSLQIYNKEIYDSINNSVNDIMIFDFRKHCPNSIKMQSNSI